MIILDYVLPLNLSFLNSYLNTILMADIIKINSINAMQYYDSNKYIKNII
jgi:hypothetical protein